ncbi:MAG: tetratricopeptide repeat protein [Elainellaceae cyanobacterium]
MMLTSSIDDVIQSLTPRRKQVLKKLLVGASDADIAKEIDVSEPTVRKHIERICDVFTQALPDYHGQKLKRSDLIRVVAGHRPQMTVPQPQLHDEAQQLNQKGFNEYMAGNFAIAVQYFQAAIALHPDYANAHYNLGTTYERLQQNEKAKSHYKKARDFQGKGAYAAICNLARLNILEGQPQAALQPLEDCLDDEIEEPLIRVSLHKNLGWALYLLGQYDRSLEQLQQAIALDPSSTASYCLLAQVYEATENLDYAKHYWKKCLDGCKSNLSDSTQRPWRWPEIDIWQAQAFQFLHNYSEPGKDHGTA